MKKILMALALLAGTQVTTFAQDGSVQRERLTPAQRMEKKADVMEEKLQLSPDQKKQIMEADRKMLDERKGARIENKEEMQTIRQKHDEEYKKILTDEQNGKYEQLKMERKGSRERKKM